jgi:hypothetical protein
MLAASWSIHQLPCSDQLWWSEPGTPASAAPRRPWCRQGPSRARACQGCRAPPPGEGRPGPPAASGPPRRRARQRHRRTGRRALLHLARRCGWRVATWSRFPAGQIVPAGTAITVLIGSRGEPLNQADAEAPGPGHRSRRGHDLGIGSVGRGAWGGRPAGSEPGGDPPKPPGAAPPGPSTARGVRTSTAASTSGNRSGRPRFRARTLCPGGCRVLSS